ncbi:MAG: hypothetical protein A2X23_08860 [Chloroflexi bacterium GWC2_73_18]|nr:MAG: hypothetical protein A2X23_08860 [Chloroflexi bacterium GWC2_73_18]
MERRAVLTIVLTRHGRTPRSEPEQHLGQGVDVGLSAEGQTEAQALARRLSEVGFDRVVTSPARRARETAEILCRGRDGPTLEEDARLAEMDYGAWEGLTYEQIDARDGAYRRRWEKDPAALACPGGESGDQVAARARSFLADAISRGPEGGRILVVGHATLGRILLCLALGIPGRDFRRRFRQDPASLTVLRFPGSVEDGALLLVANDTAHLGDTRGGWG